MKCSPFLLSFLCLFIGITPHLYASDRYPLSEQSQQQIKDAAIGSALICGTAAGLITVVADVMSQDSGPYESTWQSLQKVCWLRVVGISLLAAAVGGAAGALVKYCTVDEHVLEDAEGRLFSVRVDNSLFFTQMENHPESSTFSWWQSKKFPRISAYNYLNSLQKSLNSLKQDFVTLSRSSIQTVSEKAGGWLSFITDKDQAITQRMSEIVQDPNYVKELTTQKELELMDARISSLREHAWAERDRAIAYRQMASARQQEATASLIQALKPTPPPIVVVTAPVIKPVAPTIYPVYHHNPPAAPSTPYAAPSPRPPSPA